MCSPAKSQRALVKVGCSSALTQCASGAIDIFTSVSLERGLLFMHMHLAGILQASLNAFLGHLSLVTILAGLIDDTCADPSRLPFPAPSFPPPYFPLPTHPPLTSLCRSSPSSEDVRGAYDCD
jgi:hypothetical protein